MNLILVRHGETEDNFNNLYCGKTDKSLSIKGIEDTKNLKGLLNGIAINMCITSPLKRAIETANILYGGEILIDNRLREIDFGIFEGLSYEEALKKFPIEMKNWSANYINYKIPEGESLIELNKRCIDFLNDIQKYNGNILVVTHGGVIRCILANAFNNISFFYKFKVDNSSISILEYLDGYHFLKGLNIKHCEGKDLL